MKDDIMKDLENKARHADLLGKYADATRLRVELERIHDQVGIDGTEKAKNLNQLAFLAARSGELSEAVRAAEKCLATYRDIPNRRDEKLATYLMMMAYLLADSRRFSEAVPYGEEGLSLFVGIYGEQDDFVQFRAKDIECMRNGIVRSYLDK